MDRRGFLSTLGAVTAAGATASVGGCVERVGLGGPAVAEREPPDRPETLTPTAVADYVAATEETYAHNHHARNGATAVSVTATATFDYQAVGGYHATAQHAGSVRVDGDETAEVSSRPIPYRVTDDATLRLSVDRERVGSDAAESGDGNAAADEVASPLGVRVANVLDRAREVSLRVTRQEDGETLFEAARTVDGRQAVELRGIAAQPGSYRVVARFAEDGVTGEGRIDIELPHVDRGPNVDVLSSSRGFATRPLPRFEPI
jgi:hypothetical protein